MINIHVFYITYVTTGSLVHVTEVDDLGILGHTLSPTLGNCLDIHISHRDYIKRQARSDNICDNERRIQSQVQWPTVYLS